MIEASQQVSESARLRRKRAGIHSLLYFALIALATSSDLAAAQTAIPMSSPMPKSPSAILALAEGANGFSSLDLKPWHLKASYQTFNESGQPADAGVFEEWWAGPKEYKRSYTTMDSTHTEYVTDTGTYKTGTRNFLPAAELLLESRLLDPIPEAGKDVVLQEREQSVGNVPLQCVVFARKMMNLESAPTALFPTYCFDSSKPMLRWSGSYGQRNALYNHILIFQGRYIAQDLTISENDNRTVLSAHVDVVEPLGKMDAADFSPPAGAVHTDAPAVIDAKKSVLQGRPPKKPMPEYPAYAKQRRIEGDVIINAEISEDGRVYEMTVVSAPDPSLAIAALLAVREWQYQPYLLNGEAVCVHTQIKVAFRVR